MVQVEIDMGVAEMSKREKKVRSATKRDLEVCRGKDVRKENKSIAATSTSKRKLVRRRRIGWPKNTRPSPHVLYRCSGGPWHNYLLSLPVYQLSTMAFRIPSRAWHGTGVYKTAELSDRKLTGNAAARIRFVQRTEPAWRAADIPMLVWHRLRKVR